MKKVYHKENYQQIENFYGEWGWGQHRPQHIYIAINGETEKVYIATELIGGGWPANVWHDLVRWIGLPCGVYDDDEINVILEELKEDIQKLLESFSSRWDGQNHVGNWDMNLVEKIENKIEKMPETKLFWDETGMMEN